MRVPTVSFSNVYLSFCSMLIYNLTIFSLSEDSTTSSWSTSRLHCLACTQPQWWRTITLQWRFQFCSRSSPDICKIRFCDQEQNNLLGNLHPEEYKAVISNIKHCILATDLALFFPNKARLANIVKENTFDWEHPDHRWTKSYFPFVCLTAFLAEMRICWLGDWPRPFAWQGAISVPPLSHGRPNIKPLSWSMKSSMNK